MIWLWRCCCNNQSLMWNNHLLVRNIEEHAAEGKAWKEELIMEYVIHSSDGYWPSSLILFYIPWWWKSSLFLSVYMFDLLREREREMCWEASRHHHLLVLLLTISTVMHFHLHVASTSFIILLKFPVYIYLFQFK